VGRQVTFVIQDTGIGTFRNWLNLFARAVDILVPTTSAGEDVNGTAGVVGEGELGAHEIPASLQGEMTLTATGVVTYGVLLVLVVTTGAFSTTVTLLTADIAVAVLADAVAVFVTFATIKIIRFANVVTVGVEIALFVGDTGVGTFGESLVLFFRTNQVFVGVALICQGSSAARIIIHTHGRTLEVQTGWLLALTLAAFLDDARGIARESTGTILGDGATGTLVTAVSVVTVLADAVKVFAAWEAVG